jgi:hypothetical protein
MDKALTFHCQLLRKLQPALVSFGHVYLVAIILQKNLCDNHLFSFTIQKHAAYATLQATQEY